MDLFQEESLGSVLINPTGQVLQLKYKLEKLFRSPTVAPVDTTPPGNSLADQIRTLFAQPRLEKEATETDPTSDSMKALVQGVRAHLEELAQLDPMSLCLDENDSALAPQLARVKQLEEQLQAQKHLNSELEAKQTMVQQLVESAVKSFYSLKAQVEHYRLEFASHLQNVMVLKETNAKLTKAQTASEALVFSLQVKVKKLEEDYATSAAASNDTFEKLAAAGAKVLRLEESLRNALSELERSNEQHRQDSAQIEQLRLNRQELSSLMHSVQQEVILKEQDLNQRSQEILQLKEQLTQAQTRFIQLPQPENNLQQVSELTSELVEVRARNQLLKQLQQATEDNLVKLTTENEKMLQTNDKLRAELQMKEAEARLLQSASRLDRPALPQPPPASIVLAPSVLPTRPSLLNLGASGVARPTPATRRQALSDEEIFNQHDQDIEEDLMAVDSSDLDPQETSDSQPDVEEPSTPAKPKKPRAKKPKASASGGTIDYGSIMGEAPTPLPLRKSSAGVGECCGQSLYGHLTQCARCKRRYHSTCILVPPKGTNYICELCVKQSLAKPNKSKAPKPTGVPPAAIILQMNAKSNKSKR